MFVMVKLTIKVIKIIGMAFVTNSSRKNQQFLANPQFPSPAHYQLKQGETNRECAPFRSTSVRKIISLQGTQQTLPGPGQYEISKQIIKPKISAYLNNDNIIIKINSTGSPQFKSDTVRFKDPPVPKHTVTINTGLQPQNSQENNNQTKKVSRINIHKLPQIQRSRFASIPSKIRILNQDEPNDQPSIEIKQQPTPGPGFYSSLLSKHINSKGTVWGKDSSKRFLNASTIEVGPGQYSIPNTVQLKNAKEQSANFKSGTVRSFFDSIMYESSVEQVVSQRQRQNFKSPQPAPGQYDYPESFAKYNKVQNSFQLFGSAVDRFVNKQIKANSYNQFYNVGQYFGNNNSFNKLKCAFNSQTQRNPSFLDSVMHLQTPGPGKYYHQSQFPHRKKGKNIQMFGSLTERTHQPIKDKQTPQSHEDQKDTESQLLKNRFNQLQHESFTFKSNTDRQCFGTIKSQTKLGQYDLSYYDVATKLEKQRICIQNLKKIQVIKPPFESNMSRFEHYQSPSKIKRRKPSQLPQRIPKQNQQRQTKHLSILGKIGKEKRFAKQKIATNSPEVGTYNCTIGWDKPSFNVRFQQN